MRVICQSLTDTLQLGQRLGQALRGGEVIVLVGDIGAGKTTLVKGVARGLAITDDIQSPTFTISRLYHGRDDIQLAHYDFYRLGEAGVISQELLEDLMNPQTCVIVEWAETVSQVLPAERLQMTITTLADGGRRLELVGFDTGNMNMEQK